MATIHVDEIKAMARRAHEDAAFREELFAEVVRDHAVDAAWVLTHLPKTDNEYIAEHREELVEIATTTNNVSLRRITLTLLERIDWSVFNPDDVPQYYVNLLDFSMAHLMMAEEPYGVRSLCMKLAYSLSLPYPELLGELKRSLLMLEPSDLGSGVRCTYNKILKKI